MRLTLFVTALALAAQFPTASANAQLAGTAQLSTSAGDLKIVAVGYRASKLLHSAVYNEDSKRVGEVSDIVVTPHASVSYMIVAVGGFLGLGRKDVAIPARDFTIINNKVVLPGATKAALTSLPAFHYSKL